jgi:uncharacterized membrane protein
MLETLPGAAGRSRFRRFLIARRRLLSCLLAGLVAVAVLPEGMGPATRWLLAWDVTAGLYVALAFVMIARSTVETCHWRAALYDEGDWMIVLIVVACGAASFVAIFAELVAIRSRHVAAAPALVVAGLTVAVSWTFTHLSFTLHYANLYYRRVAGEPSGRERAGGLRFPGNREPDYGDFLYYAFVIGCAAQTGDVETESSVMRRVSLVHGVVAFAFNTAILALTINVGASLLAP